MSFASIPELLDELRAGRMVVIVDDEDRENEGDLIMPAELVRPADQLDMALVRRTVKVARTLRSEVLPWYLRWLGLAAALVFSVALAAWTWDAGRRFAGFDRGEVEQDPCLARLFPDYDTLCSHPRYDEVCETLYRRLADWANDHVAWRAHPEPIDGAPAPHPHSEDASA